MGHQETGSIITELAPISLDKVSGYQPNHSSTRYCTGANHHGNSCRYEKHALLCPSALLWGAFKWPPVFSETLSQWDGLDEVRCHGHWEQHVCTSFNLAAIPTYTLLPSGLLPIADNNRHCVANALLTQLVNWYTNTVPLIGTDKRLSPAEKVQETHSQGHNSSSQVISRKGEGATEKTYDISAVTLNRSYSRAAHYLLWETSYRCPGTLTQGRTQPMISLIFPKELTLEPVTGYCL